jgi:hypothetical protein
VSTGIVSRPNAKAITTAAVLGPTPGSDERYSAISASERDASADRS